MLPKVFNQREYVYAFPLVGDHTDNISLQNSANFADAMFIETRTVEYLHKEWIEIQVVSIESSIELNVPHVLPLILLNDNLSLHYWSNK